MISILQSLSKTIHLSLGIAILLFLGLYFLEMVLRLTDIFLAGYLDICTYLQVLCG